jgi:hypothetical protein
VLPCFAIPSSNLAILLIALGLPCCWKARSLSHVDETTPSDAHGDVMRREAGKTVRTPSSSIEIEPDWKDVAYGILHTCLVFSCLATIKTPYTPDRITPNSRRLVQGSSFFAVGCHHGSLVVTMIVVAACRYGSSSSALPPHP